MKKIIVFLFVCCITQAGFAQQFDEEVIINACHCINRSEGKENIDSIINDCLSRSLLFSLGKEGISKEKLLEDYAASAGSQNQSTFGTYLEMLSKTCWATQLLVEKKQARYYKMSDSEPANRYYTECLDYENKEALDSAIVSVEKALASDSLFVFAWDKAGALYEKRNQQDKAIVCFQHSLRIFPEGNTALNRLGLLYLSEEDYEQAMKIYTRLINYYPKNIDGYLGLARISFRNRDYPTTIRLIQHIYRDCQEKNPEYLPECREYMKVSYYYMKKEGNEDLFREIAEEFVPPLYQPEDFDRLQDMKLNSEIDCRLMEPQVLICSDYILSTPVNHSDQNREYAIAAVKKWMESTPDFIFHLNKNVAPVLDKKGDVLPVFITAMVEFSIRNPEKGNDQKAVALYAWNRFLDYASNPSNNIRLTGAIKKMMKAREKGTLEKQLAY